MTDTANHTSGPWEIGHTYLTHNHPARRWETPVNAIGTGYVSDGIGATEEESIANANLIAAAPELLEQLKELVNASTEFASSDSQMIGFMDSQQKFDDAVEKALSVIAKAEGR